MRYDFVMHCGGGIRYKFGFATYHDLINFVKNRLKSHVS